MNNKRNLLESLQYSWMSKRHEAYFRKVLKKYGRDMKKRNTLIHSLPEDHVLILAPHVHDEVLGCGGALIKYAKKRSSGSCGLSRYTS